MSVKERKPHPYKKKYQQKFIIYLHVFMIITYCLKRFPLHVKHVVAIWTISTFFLCFSPRTDIVQLCLFVIEHLDRNCTALQCPKHFLFLFHLKLTYKIFSYILFSFYYWIFELHWRGGAYTDKHSKTTWYRPWLHRIPLQYSWNIV